MRMTGFGQRRIVSNTLIFICVVTMVCVLFLSAAARGSFNLFNENNLNEHAASMNEHNMCATHIYAQKPLFSNTPIHFPRHLFVNTTIDFAIQKQGGYLSTKASLAKSHLHQLIPVFIIFLYKLKNVTLLPKLHGQQIWLKLTLTILESC